MIDILDRDRWVFSKDGQVALSGFCFCDDEDRHLTPSAVFDLYIRYGIDAFLRIRGEYLIALILSTKVIVVRDHVGIVPAYYTFQGGRLQLCTTIGAVLRNNVSRTLNGDYLRAIRNDDFSLLEQTPLAGVGRIPGGSFLSLENGHVEIQKYWYANPLKKKSNSAELLKSVLITGMRQRLRFGKCGLLLSGGYDSTLLGSIAAWLIRRQEAPYHFATYSLAFADDKVDDRENLNRVVAVLGLDSDIQSYDEKRPEEFFLSSQEARLGIFYDPTLWFFKPTLQQAEIEKCQIVMTGLGGDDLFSTPPPLRNRLLFWLPSWIFTVLYKVVKRSMRQAGFGVVIQSQKHCRSAQHMATLERLVFSGTFQFAIEQEQELASRYGLRMSYPLLDSRIVELVSGLKKRDFRIGGVWSKPLLRLATRSFVPDFMMRRVSKQNYQIPRKQIVLSQIRSGESWFLPKNDKLRVRTLQDLDPAQLNDILLGCYENVWKGIIHERQVDAQARESGYEKSQQTTT